MVPMINHCQLTLCQPPAFSWLHNDHLQRPDPKFPAPVLSNESRQQGLLEIAGRGGRFACDVGGLMLSHVAGWRLSRSLVPPLAGPPVERFPEVQITAGLGATPALHHECGGRGAMLGGGAGGGYGPWSILQSCAQCRVWLLNHGDLHSSLGEPQHPSLITRHSVASAVLFGTSCLECVQAHLLEQGGTIGKVTSCSPPIHCWHILLGGGVEAAHASKKAGWAAGIGTTWRPWIAIVQL